MHFANPHFLWLLLVLPPVLLGFLWWAAHKRQRLLSGFIQARLLPELTVGISPRRERWRTALLVGASVALIVALARLQWGFTWEEAHQKGLDIVVAIDTSKSMLAEDIAPNRLERAKLAALDLMQTAKSDRLGLVAFAGTAFLQCPLTIDDGAFRQSVEMLDVNTLPQGGTAIADAINTALAAFKQKDNYKVLVLFTDGEDHDSHAVEAARKAAEQGLRIFTIGIGSPEGELLQIHDANGHLDYVRDENGNAVKSHLNEALLQEIATAGHGFYLPMRGAKVIDTLYRQGIAPLPKTESKAKLYRRYHEHYHWPLALAILMLMAEFLLPARSRAKPAGYRSTSAPAALNRAAVIVGFLLVPLLATASTSSALHDYREGQFDKAQTEYQRLFQKNADDLRLALNAGTAAYRSGKLKAADSLLSKAVTAPDLHIQQEAFYNRGNTRFRTGEEAQELEAKKSAWEKALQDFDSAMKLDNRDADAKHNYEFVKKKLEELKKQQQQQKKKNQQQQNQKQKQDKQKQQNQQQKQDQKQNQQKSNQQKQDQQKNQSQQQQRQNEQKQQQEKQDQQQANQQKQGEKKPDQQPKPDEHNNAGEQKQQQAAANPQRQGEMSREQAIRVLNTMKGDEQVLPLQKLEAPPPTNRKFKDW